MVFQGLQANAKWWHILSSQGVKIDPRTFQSSDVVQRDASIRAVVAQLLERSGMDLELAIDYCRQFDVEPEYASLVYIEKVMLLPPSGLFMSGTLAATANDAVWARSVRRAAAGIEEKVTHPLELTTIYLKDTDRKSPLICQLLTYPTPYCSVMAPHCFVVRRC